MGGRQWVRIIGGIWRGRRLRFPAAADLRPTPDRVRETLFNWLQGVIVEARCLDLFAGSGALGFEALSRGAGETVFVERDRRVVLALRESVAQLGGDAAKVVEGDVPAWLATATGVFDVVFLDPPYAREGLAELCTLLERRGLLAENACVYLETAARGEPPVVPVTWSLWRETSAGAARGMLFRRAVAAPVSTV